MFQSLDDFKEKLTVIFLVDVLPPQNIVLLCRGSDRKFAPNLYTGLGGKIETSDRNQKAGAQCELIEESKGEIDVEITEFARVNINDVKIICYFWGLYKEKELPECSEGVLEWVPVSEVFTKDIISTTRYMIQEWQRQAWSLDKAFTVYLKRADDHDINAPVLSVTAKDGLSF